MEFEQSTTRLPFTSPHEPTRHGTSTSAKGTNENGNTGCETSTNGEETSQRCDNGSSSGTLTADGARTSGNRHTSRDDQGQRVDSTPSVEAAGAFDRSHTEQGDSRPPLHKLLLQDSALYSNPHLPTVNEHTTLEELAHLVRLSKYQQRKCAITRTRLRKSLISTALNARLTRCGEVAHRNLADNFRRDDKDSFAALYNAIQDVRKSCDELRRFAALEPDMEPLASPILGSSENLDSPVTASPDPYRTMSPFLHEIAESSRTTFLHFINQIRTNPDYLATRICSLTSSELNAFLIPHRALEPVDTVLPSHGRPTGRSHSSTNARSSSKVDVDRLLSFHRHDPISILVHTCFANSAGPESGEDLKRTDVWATTLARLISEPKSNGEQFVISVLNVWTAMRDWSGRSKMEWYLLKILRDGAFLLDRAEDPHGTRFNLSDWTQTDEGATRKFYDQAVNELFDLVDDEDGTGIPEGLLELGNAILQKLKGPTYVENTSRWLVWRCLFSVFLLGVIIHPESYGMLADYHITPYAREQILKKVAMKAYEYVSSMWSGKPPATHVPLDVPPTIKDHIDKIVTKFQDYRFRSTGARLLPARSITSLRETAEVHPYLVICPADLATLVNALFPERRPQSSASVRSVPVSLSALSINHQPLSNNDGRSNIETASIISTSASSVPSEISSAQENGRDDLNARSPTNHSILTQDSDAERKSNNYEDDGFRLRFALHETSQSLGREVVKGTGHPCAERWAIVFVSSDGQELSTRMGYDPEDAPDEDDYWSSSDTEDDETENGTQLDKDYHQLRDSILQLVEDFEIPQNPQSVNDTAHFSNRAHRIKKHRSSSKIAITESSRPSSNPFRRPEDLTIKVDTFTGERDTSLSTNPGSTDSILETMLKAAIAQSKSQADFVSSHFYWKTLSQLKSLDSPTLRRDGFSALIHIFSRGPRDTIRRCVSAIEEYDAWLVWLKQSQERQEGSIERMIKQSRAIRDKMWYVTDIRNSKEYAHTRDVCQALRTMGLPHRWRSFQQSRSSMTRGPGSSYLYRTESQIMDLLAATEEQGGPNKLSDDQAEMTAQWLKQSGVENFCQGEERIHRFCCEVDKCIAKLVGETIREAPVLWSSDLYKRDKIVFDHLQARERDTISDDRLGSVSENDRRFAGQQTSFSRDLRGKTSQNMSQRSMDSLRMHLPRTSATFSETHDGYEYFEKTSPFFGNAAQGTFWSPFQPAVSPSYTAAYSPTTSLTNLSTTFSGFSYYADLPSNSSVSNGRPGTSASSNDTAFPVAYGNEKSRFLRELRSAVTSLILSDLGVQVFSRGSETDTWFQGLGQECIDRREALLLRETQKLRPREQTTRRSATRPRVIEKKKSFGDLRNIGDGKNMQADASDGASTRSSATPPGDSNSDHTPRAGDFPYRKSYERLLVMFCVHPNPVAKLEALKKLESLIMASISANGGRKRSRLPYGDGGSATSEPERLQGRPTLLDETIDNAKVRRSLAMQNSTYLSNNGSQRQSNVETRSVLSAYTANTDAVTDELRKLFKDASIRPQTLFRDLQLIAAFVPASILDKPDMGKAFWNAGIAALKLKAEVCRTMVEMADEVVAARTSVRKASTDELKLAKNTLSASGTPPPPSSTYRLEDAGKMWAITAKEGSPTAQRELALFYLSNPEFVARTVLPLSKPREIFKKVVIDKYGRPKHIGSALGSGNLGSQLVGGMGNADGKGFNGKEGDVRDDPGLMCVAIHWMEAAEQGGDDLATSFLRQNESWA